MKKLRRLSVLILLVGSLFFTGCDAGQLAEFINKVVAGIEQVLPAIKDVANAFQGIANDTTATNNDNTNTNTTTATDQQAGTDAGVTIPAAGDQETVGTTTSAEAAANAYPGGRLSPSAFAATFGPAAREAMKSSGVPASIILAQAALETGWGASTIGGAKNLFGIKGTGPAGTTSVSTQEFINGRMVSVRAGFRKYNSWTESIADHSRLLQNSRYRNAMNNKDNPDQFARELQRAGYATDPNYASKLISIMKQNNLYQYDN